MRRPCRLLGLATLVVLVGAGHAQAQPQEAPIVLSGARDAVELGPRFAFFADTTGALGLADVQGADFRVDGRRVPRFGYGDETLWARVRIRSATAHRWWLVLPNRSLDHVTVYLQTATGTDVVGPFGDARPFAARPLPSRALVVPLPPLPPEATLYLRVSSDGPLRLPVRLQTPEAFALAYGRDAFFLGGFFGVLGIVLVYNLVLYGLFRDRSSLYYLLYLVSFIVYQVSVERIGFQHVWPGLPAVNDWMQSLMGLMCAVWGILFARAFLHTADVEPGVDRVLRGAVVLCLALMPVVLLAPGRITNQMVLWSYLGMTLLVLWAGVMALLRGQPAAKLYLAGWSFLLLSIVVFVLSMAGLLPIDLPGAETVQVGSVLEVTFLSLALADRYNRLREEREAMRLRIASDLHDDIGSGLTQISLYSELTRRHSEGPAAAWADRAGDLARALTGQMQDLVWAIKPEAESWESLELRMKDFATGLLAARGVDFSIEGEEAFHHEALPPDVRRGLLLMFKEILHNTVKHAAASTVTVRYRVTREAVWLRICDDGRGFDPAEVRPGTGLGSLERRATALGARLDLDAAPGRPTCYEIDVPVRRGAPMRET